jgi:DNA-binding response OmpR family regulator
MSKILLVEDDPKYADLVCDCLGQTHAVEVTKTVTTALEFLSVYSYELVIVDWHLPDAEGPALISKLRTQGLSVPILMLTARDTVDDKEHGFNMGADDYLTKAADPRELLVRVRALLRRPAPYKNETVKIANNIEINLGQRGVTKNGEQIHMLPKEFAVLEFMARYPNRVFSAEELLERLWPSESEASSHTVRATINRIRAKLDDPDSPSVIQTKYKAGYQLSVANAT